MKMAFVRRMCLLLICFLLMITCLISCAEKEESALKMKDEMAFSVPGEIGGDLNPFFATKEGDLDVLAVLTERFISSDGVSEVNGAVGDDGILTVTITLKEGIFCSQKSEVLAVDFYYAVHLVCDPTYDGPLTALSESSIVGLTEFRNGQTKELSGIECVDKYTCKVLFADSREDYHTLLDLPMVHSANYGGYSYGKCAATDVEGKYAKVIGSGPWHIERLIANDGKLWNLIPNEYYHGRETDAVDVTLRHVRDTDVGLNMKLGQLTAGFLYDKDEAQRQAQKYGFTAIPLADGALLCCKDADFTDKLSETMTIRQALTAIMTFI